MRLHRAEGGTAKQNARRDKGAQEGEDVDGAPGQLPIEKPAGYKEQIVSCDGGETACPGGQAECNKA